GTIRTLPRCILKPSSGCWAIAKAAPLRTRKTEPRASASRFRVHPLQLPARGEDVEAARLPHEAGDRLPYDLLERHNPLGSRRLERNPGPGIQRNEVYFAIEVRDEAHHAPGIGIRIVDAAQQHIFEGELFPRPQWILFARFEQIGK